MGGSSRAFSFQGIVFFSLSAFFFMRWQCCRCFETAGELRGKTAKPPNVMSAYRTERPKSTEQSESTSNSSDRWKHFSIVIDRTGGRHLGLAVRQSADTNQLQVMRVDTGVESGPTCAGVWNSSNAEKVQEGDHIVHVNGITDVAELVAECMKMQELRIGVRRRVCN